MIGRRFLAVFAALLAGCSLSSSVVLEPLRLLPDDVSRPATLQEAMNRGDYRAAVSMRRRIEGSGSARPEELALLARAHIHAALYDDAERILERALGMRISSRLRGNIELDLADIAYLEGDIARALEMTLRGKGRGVEVHQWYVDLLASLRGVDLHAVGNVRSAVCSFRFGMPDLPRIETTVNRVRLEAIIDSGASISIVSRSLAESASIRLFDGETGTLHGLLGRPIAVDFGLIDSLRIGDMIVRNVPVAVMSDENLSFFFASNQPFQMHLLIGSSLLRHYRLRFDYGLRKLTFHYVDPADRQPVEDQNLFLVDQKPLVHVAINRQAWFPFLLDTGSELTFLNEARLVRPKFTLGIRGVHGTKMQGLGGARKHGGRVRDVSVGVDRWSGRFEHVPLYSDVASEAIGILGQNFLQRFNVEIDFGRMRVEVDPARVRSE